MTYLPVRGWAAFHGSWKAVLTALFNCSPRPSATPACFTGGFYLTPTDSTTYIIATKPSESIPLQISWDTSCLPAAEKVDIWLNSQAARIHYYKGVPNRPLKDAPKLKVEGIDQGQFKGRGYYEAQVMPRWWNTTIVVGGPEEKVNLQIRIVEHGTQPFLSTLPAGPSFTVSYTPPSKGNLPPEANNEVLETGFTTVDDSIVEEESKATSKAWVVAAVLVPLVLITVGVGLWRWKRRKNGV